MSKIVVAGGGVLGSQIAFQAAYCGADVTIWLRSKSSVERTQPKLDQLQKTYMECIKNMASKNPEWCSGIASPEDFDKKACEAKVKAAAKNLHIELDLATAVKGADLVIESVSELKKTKMDFYKTLAPLLDKKTVLVTNSSTMLPSTFAKYTGRPEKYLAMHFANAIWKNNTAEVMSQPQTDEKAFNAVVKIAKEIRMIPLPIRNEKSGYLLNSMLVPFLLSGLDLLANGISDPKSIDLAWTAGTGAPHGPFEIIDVVGIKTTYDIIEQYQKVPGLINPLLKKMMLPYNFKGMKAILEEKMKSGKMGKQSGEGFFKYK